MSTLKSLNAEKTRQVQVVLKSARPPLTNTAYMDEEGRVWKVENGSIFVRKVSLTRHPSEEFEPRWKHVAPQDMVDEVVVYDWLLQNELDREKF